MKTRLLHRASCVAGPALALLVCCGTAHAELPLQVQADLLKHELVTAIKNGDDAKVIDVAAQMNAKGFDTGIEILYYEARSNFALGNNPAGDAALERYVSKAGPEGANYKAAIALLSERLGKRKQEQQARDEADRLAAEQRNQQAEFQRSLQPVGKITSVNTDWGYAKATLAVPQLPAGSYLYVALPDGQFIPVQPGKLADGHLTLTGISQAQIPTDAALLASTLPAPGDSGAGRLRATPANDTPAEVGKQAQALAQARSTTNAPGARVLTVDRGSAAHRAGLKPGDIILSFGMFTVKSVADLQQAIAARGEKTTMARCPEGTGSTGGLMSALAGVAGAMPAESSTPCQKVEAPISKEQRRLMRALGGVTNGKFAGITVMRGDTVKDMKVLIGPLGAEVIDTRN